MKLVYLLSYIEFRKREQNIINHTHVFSNEKAALEFKKTLEDIQCVTIALHYVYENAEQLIKQIEDSKDETF